MEIVIYPGKELVDWDSVEIWCRSDQKGEGKPVSPTTKRGPIMIKEEHQVKVFSAKILNNSLPASAAACGITVSSVDEVAWRQANEQ